MSSQLVTMPLLIGYAVSSMSRAAVHSSPIMISCVRKRYRSQHTAAACTRHPAIPARTFSCTFWIFSSERRMGRPTIEGKMCAGKLSPAKPHFTNCAKTVHRGRGAATGGSGRSVHTPVPLSHTTGGLFMGAGATGESRRREQGPGEVRAAKTWPQGWGVNSGL